MLVLKRYLGPKKFWAKKNYGFKNILGPKQIFENILGLEKNFGLKKSGSTKIVGKKFWHKKISGRKKISG